MKKIVILLFSILLVGCAAPPTKSDAKQNFQFKTIIYEYHEDESYSIEVIEDKETGCQYITNSRGMESKAGGITPFLDSRGKPAGCRDEQ